MWIGALSDVFRQISMMYATISSVLSLGVLALAAKFLPLTMAFLPAWMAYWYVAGTIWTGAWVVAHECGHGAFSDNRLLQDTVGYILHTALLVPYFSWQRSHAVHHSKTNHVLEGETHVPYTMESGKKTLAKREFFHNALGERLGDLIYGGIRCVSHLVFGWPAYLLAGVTGGPVRGVTNHFIPIKPFSTGDKNTELFPGVWKNKVRFKMCDFLVVLVYLSFHIQRKINETSVHILFCVCLLTMSLYWAGLALGHWHCGDGWPPNSLGDELRRVAHVGAVHGPPRCDQLLARHVHMAPAH